MTALTAFLSRYGFTDGTPSISKTAGRRQLCELFRDLGYTRGVEIGTWEGSYAEQLCHANPGVHLTCVDPWRAYDAYREVKNDQGRLDAAYALTQKRLAPYACRILRMTSLEAAPLIPDGSLGFAYVDGNHRAAFVRQDLEAWAQKVRSGGCVAGHDYGNWRNKPFIEVQQAVDRFVAERGIRQFYVLAADKSPSWFWMKA